MTAYTTRRTKMATQINNPAETKKYNTFRLHGIIYLPHYTKDCYVSPSNREYTWVQLQKAGATYVAEELWIRAKHKPLA